MTYTLAKVRDDRVVNWEEVLPLQRTTAHKWVAIQNKHFTATYRCVRITCVSYVKHEHKSVIYVKVGLYRTFGVKDDICTSNYGC